MLRDVKAKTSVDNLIDMTGIPASPEKETVQEKMSKMQISSKLVNFVFTENNDIDECCQSFIPELNKCQEHILLNKVTRNNLFTSSPVFCIKNIKRLLHSLNMCLD